MLKKVVILGPVSTGKSTLCGQLADQFQTAWVPEYAREYLLKHGMDYTYDDLLTIAKGQIALEEKYELSARSSESGIDGHTTPGSPLSTHHSQLTTPNRLLFIDTDMYVMKVWCEFVFNNCHRFILDQIVERKYDLYLLCNIDLPWTRDELREYPDLASRQTLYSIYKDIMINQSVPWVEISGSYDERLQKAIAAVNNFL